MFEAYRNLKHDELLTAFGCCCRQNSPAGELLGLHLKNSNVLDFHWGRGYIEYWGGEIIVAEDHIE